MLSRINEIINYYMGGSVLAFAGKINMTQQSVYKYVKGETKAPAQFLENILFAFPEISAEWLMRGEGNMIKSDKTSKTINVYRQGGDGEGQTNVVGDGNDLSDKEALMMALKQNQMLIDALLKK